MKSKINIKSILVIAIIGIISLVFFNQSFAANTAKVNVEVANIRKSANADSAIIEQVPQGKEVEILEKTGDWYKIKYNNVQGYLRKDLLDIADETTQEDTNTITNSNEIKENNTNATNSTVENTIEENNVEPKEQETATETVDNSTGMYTCKENIKLKIMPLILGKDIKEIKKDATVNVLEINNKWALVESGTNRGWVLVSKIQKVEDNKEQTKTTEEKKDKSTEKTETTKEVKMYVSSEVVNLRKEESTSSDTLAQLEKGTQVTVISENNGWSKVKVNNKQGYISSSLLSERKPETTTSRGLETARKEITNDNETSKKSETASTETKKATSNNTTTSTESKKTTTSAETKTTTSNNSSTPAKTSDTKTSSTTNKGQEVCNYAKQFLGCKYVYGGTSPKGFDCSGFTQYVYKHFGVTLNRTSQAQASNGKSVKKADLKPGDLVIFSGHVGIYIGDGKFIHAANSKKGVIITSLSDSYYVKNYITARRIFN